MPNRHRVERTEFDVGFATASEALISEEGLAPLVEQRLLSVVADVFDEKSAPGQVRRFDRLEIDLGSVGGIDRVATLERRLKTSLRNAIDDQPADTGSEREPRRRGRQSSDDEDSFEFFLARGVVPAGHEWASASDLDQRFRRLLGLPVPALREFFARVVKNPNTVTRFARLCPKIVRKRLVALLYLDESTPLRQVLGVAEADLALASIARGRETDAISSLCEQLFIAAMRSACGEVSVDRQLLQGLIAESARLFDVSAETLVNRLQKRAEARGTDLHGTWSELQPSAASEPPVVASSDTGARRSGARRGEDPLRASSDTDQPSLPPAYRPTARDPQEHLRGYELLSRALRATLDPMTDATDGETAALLVEQLGGSAPWLLQRLFASLAIDASGIRKIASHPHRDLAQALFVAYCELASPSSTGGGDELSSDLMQRVIAIGSLRSAPAEYYARVLFDLLQGRIPDLHSKSSGHQSSAGGRCADTGESIGQHPSARLGNDVAHVPRVRDEAPSLQRGKPSSHEPSAKDRCADTELPIGREPSIWADNDVANVPRDRDEDPSLQPRDRDVDSSRQHSESNSGDTDITQVTEHSVDHADSPSADGRTAGTVTTSRKGLIALLGAGQSMAEFNDNGRVPISAGKVQSGAAEPEAMSSMPTGTNRSTQYAERQGEEPVAGSTTPSLDPRSRNPATSAVLGVLTQRLRALLPPGSKAATIDDAIAILAESNSDAAVDTIVDTAGNTLETLIDVVPERVLAGLFLARHAANGGDLLVLAELITTASVGVNRGLGMRRAQSTKWATLFDMSRHNKVTGPKTVASELLLAFAAACGIDNDAVIRRRVFAKAPRGLHVFVAAALADAPAPGARTVLDRESAGAARLDNGEEAKPSQRGQGVDGVGDIERQDITIANAGLVIAAVFIPRFLERLGMLADGDVVDRERAVHLLQLLVRPFDETPEFGLVLNKLVCGMQPWEPIPRSIEPSRTERDVSQELLKSLIHTWSALGTCSVENLQTSFLQRDGMLRFDGECWQLAIPQHPLDVLLDRLPWSYSVVKFGWMDSPIYVDWQ